MEIGHAPRAIIRASECAEARRMAPGRWWSAYRCGRTKKIGLTSAILYPIQNERKREISSLTPITTTSLNVRAGRAPLRLSAPCLFETPLRPRLSHVHHVHTCNDAIIRDDSRAFGPAIFGRELRTVTRARAHARQESEREGGGEKQPTIVREIRRFRVT